MGGMKTKNVHEFLIPSVGLFLVLSLWSAAPSALVSAQNLTTFMLSDGDNVTCYPIQSQTSLSGGAAYNRYPSTQIIPGSSTDDTRGAMRAWQTMAEEVGDCPDGTIPIRAPRGNGLAWHPLRPSQKTLQSDAIFPPRDYAIASIYEQPNQTWYKGTEVLINVWDPYVESTNEFSLSQLWLSSGMTNTIEAGYQVSNGQYGDGLPRLFVFWTADNYATSGCYDLYCSGFVQVSNVVLLGGSFSTSTISRPKGQQYEIKFRVFKDNGTGDWWLQLNDEYVGYWPQAIFNVTTPFDLADTINWGGEVVDDESSDGNRHTNTQMGSGKPAAEGYKKAAYQRNLQYVDMNDTLVDAPSFVYNTNSSCYSVMHGTDYPNWNSFFFYGGKGRSSNCGRDPAYMAPPPPIVAPPPLPTAGNYVHPPAPAPTAWG